MILVERFLDFILKITMEKTITKHWQAASIMSVSAHP